MSSRLRPTSTCIDHGCSAWKRRCTPSQCGTVHDCPCSNARCPYAAAARTANEWQGTAIWTDGSLLEDGSRRHGTPEHDAWTGVRVHMGKKQEVCDAELHAIYLAMLTFF